MYISDADKFLMCTYARCAGSMWMGILNACLQYDYSSKLRQLQDLIAVEQRHWLFGGSDKSVLEWVTCIAQYGTSLQQSKSPDVEYRAARRDNYMRIWTWLFIQSRYDDSSQQFDEWSRMVCSADRRSDRPTYQHTTASHVDLTPCNQSTSSAPCQCYERATI